MEEGLGLRRGDQLFEYLWVGIADPDDLDGQRSPVENKALSELIFHTMADRHKIEMLGEGPCVLGIVQGQAYRIGPGGQLPDALNQRFGVADLAVDDVARPSRPLEALRVPVKKEGVAPLLTVTSKELRSVHASEPGLWTTQQPPDLVVSAFSLSDTFECFQSTQACHGALPDVTQRPWTGKWLLGRKSRNQHRAKPCRRIRPRSEPRHSAPTAPSVLGVSFNDLSAAISSRHQLWRDQVSRPPF